VTDVLEIKNLNKKFPGFAIDDVSFSLPSGFIMGFIGPNGAGKTTTIKLILNLLTKDSGQISVFGQDHIINEAEIKERIGVVTDRPFYVENWKLSEVEKSFMLFYRKWNSARYNELLSRFSLDPKMKVKTLSRGMKMKLMIAAALSHDADFLILDEPTSGLDAVARVELMDILSEFISDTSKSVLFSTHITTDLEKSADYITFIGGGKIICSDTKDNLMERYRIIRGGLDVLTAEQKKQIIGYRAHGVGFDGLVECSAVRSFPESIVTEQSNLDEIIVRFNMMGGNPHE
jgi:ABC-2 type transport system ATP-binding protein